jgi:hypothetical protein
MSTATSERSQLMEVKRRLDEVGLRYGGADTYTSLMTPNVKLVSEATVGGVKSDLREYWHLYDVLSELYLQSLQDEELSFIRRNTEWGHSAAEVQASRVAARARQQPLMARVDYVDLGETRAAAEIQWKSGGPGLFLGLQAELDAALPNGFAGRPLSDPIDRFAEILGGNTRLGGAVLNDVRGLWLQSEDYLKRALGARAIDYLPVDRTEMANSLRSDQAGVTANVAGVRSPVGFLNGQEFTTLLSPALLSSLVEQVVEGRLWVETPLNVVYKQKWGMALPFDPRYSSLFSDDLRRSLIPTALVQSDLSVDLAPLVEHSHGRVPESVLGAASLMDLPELTTAARKTLVLKSGAGAGQFYNRARGVYRLTGSRKAAQQVIDLVLESATQGEPWIIQEYKSATIPIELSMPNTPTQLGLYDCHARYMVYGSYDGVDFEVFAGLANWARHWKVSGKAAASTSQGLVGSAFAPIRVVD